MAVHLDSFDGYAADTSLVNQYNAWWSANPITQATITTAAARTGKQSLHVVTQDPNDVEVFIWGAGPILTVGMGVLLDGTGLIRDLSVEAGTTRILRLQQNADWTLKAIAGGNTYNQRTDSQQVLLSNAKWHYLEFTLNIAGGGSFQVNIDGVTQIGPIAVSLGAANPDFLLILGQFYLDDFYLKPTATMLGPQSVFLLSPAAAGFHQQFTPKASTNLSQIADATPDGDATYNSATVNTDIDTFTAAQPAGQPQTLPAVAPSIVQVTAIARDNAGNSGDTYNPLMRTHSADFPNVSDSGSLTSTYTAANYATETNPSTGLAWTNAELVALEIGYEKMTGTSTTLVVTDVFAEACVATGTLMPTTNLVKRSTSISLAATMLSLAVCVRIARQDGTVLGFTSHDQDIIIGGDTTYWYSESTDVSALESALGNGVGNLDASLLLSSDRITETDIRAGRYDSAQIRVFLVDWTQPNAGELKLLKGLTGRVDIRDGAGVVEVRSLMQQAGQYVGDLLAPTCRVKALGDVQCNAGGSFANGKHLSDYQFSRTVGSVQSDVGITFSGDSQATNYYTYGRVIWTSGANNGLTGEIKSHVNTGSTAVITMQLPFPFTVVAGDTATLEAGCDRLITTCQSRFANGVNFRGEPYLPGSDALQSVGRKN